MKGPNARQAACIHECGCNPYHYWIKSTEPGWIHAVNRTNGIITHFDLVRKMPCYTWGLNEMYYKLAKPGYCFILTEKGSNCLPDRQKAGTTVGESIPGRETSVPMTWYLHKYVIEVGYDEERSQDDQSNM